MMTYFDQIKELLAKPDRPTFVGNPPQAVEPPHCFIWGKPGAAYGKTLGGTDRNIDLRFHITVSGQDAQECVTNTDDVIDILDGVTLHRDGWRTFPLAITGAEDLDSGETLPIDKTRQPPAWVVLHLRLRATKE